MLAAKYTATQIAQQEKVNAANEAAARYTASGLAELQRVQQAYKQLTNSYRQYNSAVQGGNEAGKAYWSQSVQCALNEIRSVEKKLGTLNVEEGVRKRIVDLIQQAQNAEATHAKSIQSMQDNVSEMDKTLERMGGRLLQMAATMLVLRGLTEIWQRATTFAQTYYDQLNEIRIVTGKNQQQINQ